MWLSLAYNMPAIGSLQPLVILGGREVTLEVEISATVQSEISVSLETRVIEALVDTSRSSSLERGLEVLRGS